MFINCLSIWRYVVYNLSYIYAFECYQNFNDKGWKKYSLSCLLHSTYLFSAEVTRTHHSSSVKWPGLGMLLSIHCLFILRLERLPWFHCSKQIGKATNGPMHKMVHRQAGAQESTIKLKKRVSLCRHTLKPTLARF